MSRKSPNSPTNEDEVYYTSGSESDSSEFDGGSDSDVEIADEYFDEDGFLKQDREPPLLPLSPENKAEEKQEEIKEEPTKTMGRSGLGASAAELSAQYSATLPTEVQIKYTETTVDGNLKPKTQVKTEEKQDWDEMRFNRAVSLSEMQQEEDDLARAIAMSLEVEETAKAPDPNQNVNPTIDQIEHIKKIIEKDNLSLEEVGNVSLLLGEIATELSKDDALEIHKRLSHHIERNDKQMDNQVGNLTPDHSTEEEDELARAIAMSLREANSANDHHPNIQSNDRHHNSKSNYLYLNSQDAEESYKKMSAQDPFLQSYYTEERYQEIKEDHEAWSEIVEGYKKSTSTRQVKQDENKKPKEIKHQFGTALKIEKFEEVAKSNTKPQREIKKANEFETGVIRKAPPPPPKPKSEQKTTISPITKALREGKFKEANRFIETGVLMTMTDLGLIEEHYHHSLSEEDFAQLVKFYYADTENVNEMVKGILVPSKENARGFVKIVIECTDLDMSKFKDENGKTLETLAKEKNDQETIKMLEENIRDDDEINEMDENSDLARALGLSLKQPQPDPPTKKQKTSPSPSTNPSPTSNDEEKQLQQSPDSNTVFL